MDNIIDFHKAKRGRPNLMEGFLDKIEMGELEGELHDFATGMMQKLTQEDKSIEVNSVSFHFCSPPIERVRKIFECFDRTHGKLFQVIFEYGQDETIFFSVSLSAELRVSGAAATEKRMVLYGLSYEALLSAMKIMKIAMESASK